MTGRQTDFSKKQPSGPEAFPVKISGSSASESEKPDSGPEGATKFYFKQGDG